MKPTEFDTHLEYLAFLPASEEFNDVRSLVIDLVSGQYSTVLGQVKRSLDILRNEADADAPARVRMAIASLELIEGNQDE